MTATSASFPASVDLRPDGEWLEVTLGGDWYLDGRRPNWAEVSRGTSLGGKPVRVRAGTVGHWDTSLVLFVATVADECGERKAECDLSALPEQMRSLVTQLRATEHPPKHKAKGESILAVVGHATTTAWRSFTAILHFVGECALGTARVLKRPRRFRWRECLDQMQECGAMSLPIASLIAFLIGLTFAYQAAMTLRAFGADIWVADLVGVLMVREMGPMMVAVILAGRTGAAFAATLGNMNTNEEIDALEVLGVPPVDFLVLPRLLALFLMLPLLVLYADGVGMLGGMLVSGTILQIPPTAYWIETESIVDMTDVWSGIVKAAIFGLLIGLSGCLRGLQSDRSAAGVGKAATSAVVTAIVLIILTDAVFAVLFHIFGI